MKFNFGFKHIDASQALKEYAQGRFEKIGKFLLKDSRFSVHFSRSKKHECQVEVVVSNPESKFKAQSTSDDFYNAVDEAAEKLGKQFLKEKEKHKSHHRKELSREGQLERLNPMLEYNNEPYFKKKPA